MSDRPTPETDAVYGLISIAGANASGLAPSLSRKLERERDELREANQWQTIETAPKDGTIIMLWGKTRDEATMGEWVSDEKQLSDSYGNVMCDPYWMSYDGGFTDEHPCTHWQRLPTAPT